MKVTFNKLGPVKSVTTDLSKDLIVLTGPNNTGKTYVAYALYGICAFNNRLKGFARFENIINELLNKGEYKLELESFFSKELDSLFSDFSRQFEFYLPAVLASTATFLKGFTVNFHPEELEQGANSISSKVIKSQLKFGKNQIVSIEKNANQMSLNLLFGMRNEADTIEDRFPDSILKEIINDLISRTILKMFIPNAAIAPAERIAINIFSKELSIKRNTLVDELLETKESANRINPFELLEKRATRYSLPIRDNLEIAEDLVNYKQNNSEFDFYADLLESTILKGKIVISKEGAVLFNPVRKKTLKLPVHLTATAIKSLSNLVIYLRHGAKKNDFIIIDEPELNLHPDNQVAMARFIARLVNGGFKVMISTHSDYIIREINNLIIGNKKRHIAVDQLGYKEEELLDYKRVEAILFQQNGTANIDVQDDGFDVKTIDDTIDALNMRAQKLYFED